MLPISCYFHVWRVYICKYNLQQFVETAVSSNNTTKRSSQLRYFMLLEKGEIYVAAKTQHYCTVTMTLPTWTSSTWMCLLCISSTAHGCSLHHDCWAASLKQSEFDLFVESNIRTTSGFKIGVTVYCWNVSCLTRFAISCPCLTEASMPAALGCSLASMKSCLQCWWLYGWFFSIMLNTSI